MDVSGEQQVYLPLKTVVNFIIIGVFGHEEMYPFLSLLFDSNQ